MFMQNVSRRTAIRAIMTSTVLLTGCDLRSRYSENTPVEGANWAWKARARASPSDLLELARAVLAATPDSELYKPLSSIDGVISWPRSTSRGNKWQIVFSTDSLDVDHSELSFTAKFFGAHEDDRSDETRATPEATRRLEALVAQLLQAGAGLKMSSTTRLHPL
jgi:hypothetical protein